MTVLAENGLALFGRRAQKADIRSHLTDGQLTVARRWVPNGPSTHAARPRETSRKHAQW
jgi:hypothetical protein